MNHIRLCCLLWLLTFITSGFTSKQEKINELNKSLLQAAAKGDVGQVRSLLSNGADVNAKDKFGWTALHFAANHGAQDMANLLIASGADVNVLVLDTEVYSNTGGQMSKSTPRAAVAKFAAGGKPGPKKDLGLLAMTYGNIYVTKVAVGANANQTVKAFVEAEAYHGPSLVIAYSHCIAHGINMTAGYLEQKKAVACGHWPLYRFDPRLKEQGKNPLQLDSKAPTGDFEEYAYGENRYRTLKQSKPEVAAQLIKLAGSDAAQRYALMEQLANLACDVKSEASDTKVEFL